MLRAPGNPRPASSPRPALGKKGFACRMRHRLVVAFTIGQHGKDSDNRAGLRPGAGAGPLQQARQFENAHALAAAAVRIVSRARTPRSPAAGRRGGEHGRAAACCYKKYNEGTSGSGPLPSTRHSQPALPQGVDNAAEPAVGWPHPGFGGGHLRRASPPHPSEAANGISRACLPKIPRLAGDGTIGRLDINARTDRHGLRRPASLNHESIYAGRSTIDLA